MTRSSGPIYTRKPYRLWVQLNRVNLEDLDVTGDVPVALDEEALHEMQLMHGYTREDIDDIIAPMAETAQEPTGSMGTDTPGWPSSRTGPSACSIISSSASRR